MSILRFIYYNFLSRTYNSETIIAISKYDVPVRFDRSYLDKYL